MLKRALAELSYLQPNLTNFVRVSFWTIQSMCRFRDKFDYWKFRIRWTASGMPNLSSKTCVRLLRGIFKIGLFRESLHTVRGNISSQNTNPNDWAEHFEAVGHCWLSLSTKLKHIWPGNSDHPGRAGHTSPRRNVPDSNPGCDNVHSLLMCSEHSEALIWCFPSTRLIGGPGVCTFELGPEGQ